MTEHVVPPPPTDPNLDAVAAAGLDAPNAEWMRGVAAVVDGRLAATREDWREIADPAVARACAFGLLLGLLAQRHPASRGVLERVAEAHPCYGTIPQGGRLATLERIVADEALTHAWVGPLLQLDDPRALTPLRTHGAE